MLLVNFFSFELSKICFFNWSFFPYSEIVLFSNIKTYEGKVNSPNGKLLQLFCFESFVISNDRLPNPIFSFSKVMRTFDLKLW